MRRRGRGHRRGDVTVGTGDPSGDVAALDPTDPAHIAGGSSPPAYDIRPFLLGRK
jgi:hypothetical protein